MKINCSDWRERWNVDYANYVDRVEWLIIRTLDEYVFKLAYIFNAITFYNSFLSRISRISEIIILL